MAAVQVPETAVMMQPIRFKGDDLEHYCAVEFKGDNPQGACQMYTKRCEIAGGVAESEEQAVGICDFLDKDFNIVGNFYLTRKGLRYLYRALDTRLETPRG